MTMMQSPLRTPPSILVAAFIIAVQAPTVFSWTPRLTSSCRGITNNRDTSNTGRRRVILSASKANDDNKRLDDSYSHNSDDEDEPLFAHEGQLEEYISRLEAIMESDLYVDDTRENSQRLLEGSERVVIGDWMELEDSVCFGDSCGEDDQCDIPEEYKVAHPKVDVMSFLGIRRAEPLQVNHMRDWD
eukprot:CAMPEP_0184433346 /NCGR_PEP_ID=MMETSP0738-20130409/389017_1 /TAXON_ID=385413 /ORGANISM="Thalassiosira miniscula, Strain CCMP1093" /LENGTH=186 /DNA_ID=CAMNT_0026798987 /DNA_START=25 /DNA_END=585 /DNA_ORIENTATION=+